MEGCDDQESVCSSNDREGDAFPKAFDRELVTPTNLQKAGSTESQGSAVEGDTKEAKSSNYHFYLQSIKKINNRIIFVSLGSPNSKATTDEISQNDLGRDLRTLQERRKSLLDHHWAVPSKDRYKVNKLYNLKIDYNYRATFLGQWTTTASTAHRMLAHRQ